MTRVSVAVLLLAFACGGGGPHMTSNALLSGPGPLSAVGAPHVGLVVSNPDGLHRVWLDTGRIELIDPTPGAIPISDTTYLLVASERFVIRRGRERAVVDGVRAGRRIVVSNDGRRFAVEQDNAEIAVVATADATVQRVPLAPRVPVPGRAGEHQRWVSFVWSKDDAALLVSDDDERYRLDLATGARTPIDKLEWRVNEPQEPTECPSRGLRLERRVTRDRQEIALVALAGASDPEHVASVVDRVLITATNHPSPWRGRGAGLGKPRPGELRASSFTPSCDHFVFSLEDRIYVGSVATGRFAFLMRGSPVWPPAAPLLGAR